jgi:hypothetical protein
MAMKGVFQAKRTDCVRACVASLFELSLNSVPDFTPENWGNELDDWLFDRGLAAVNIRLDEEARQMPVPSGFSLGAVDTQSKDFPPEYKHCVVCFNGRVIWCPIRGEQDGTEAAHEYTIIYPKYIQRWIRMSE